MILNGLLSQFGRSCRMTHASSWTVNQLKVNGPGWKIDDPKPVHFDLQLCSPILTSIFTVHFYFSLWSSTFTVYLHRPFLHFTQTVHFDRQFSSSILTVFYSTPIQKNFRDRPVYEYEPEYESEEIETFQMEEASYDCRDHIAW